MKCTIHTNLSGIQYFQNTVDRSIVNIVSMTIVEQTIYLYLT